MPIRFRCVGCGGILSIARRKAGANVLCPKCAVSVIVPGASTVPDPDKADEPVRSAVAGEAVIVEKKPAGEVRRKKKKQLTAVAAEPPLFEKLDFESLLQPTAKPVPAPAPAAAAVVRKPAVATAAPAKKSAAAPAPGGVIQITRIQLVAMVVLVFCLVAMAVGVGFVLGR